jgi:hypothetical protein
VPDSIRQEPEEEQCEKCQSKLNVRNTRSRTITGCHGKQRVTEVTKHCSQHPEKTFRPSKKLTPPKSKYGFDLLAEIGQHRFMEHRQITEISTILDKRNIHVPERSNENLTHRFLRYVVAVHIESLPLLATFVKQNGGYVVQVDGSTTCGSPLLLLIKDGFSGIRLLAASIPTESCECVQPYLETILEDFGEPVCAIRDRGGGIESALLNTFPEIYIITCHFHFLGNVGERLLTTKYYRFQRRVYRTGIMKKLRTLKKRLSHRKISDERDEALKMVEYVLAFKEDGKGLAFPFSVETMDFYRRCEEIRPKMQEAILARATTLKSSPCLIRLKNALDLIQPPPAVRGRIHAEYLQLIARWNWFERIRKTLRYRNGPVPLNNRGYLSDKELEDGKKELDNLQKEIEDFVNLRTNSTDRTLKQILRGILELLTERRDELFTPNVELIVNGKKNVRQLPRTNNAVEQDFRKIRRYWRRIMGNSDVEKNVQKQGVGQAIVANLEIKDYVNLVYGSLENMASRFASVTPDALERASDLFISQG